MAGFLGQHARGEELRDLLVTTALPHDVAHTPFLVGEEAISQLSFGCYAKPVTVPTERLADRVNEANSAFPIGKFKIHRRLA